MYVYLFVDRYVFALLLCMYIHCMYSIYMRMFPVFIFHSPLELTKHTTHVKYTHIKSYSDNMCTVYTYM